MILLLLRNERLRLQLFLGWLMVVGTLPMESEALKCYSCEGPDCDKPNTSATKECGKQEAACFMSGLKGAMKRGCYSKAKADCIQETIGGDCFNPDGHKELAENLRKCIDETKKEEGETGDLPKAGQGSICVCTGDLCNEGRTHSANRRTRTGLTGFKREQGKGGLMCNCEHSNLMNCHGDLNHQTCDAGNGYCMVRLSRSRTVSGLTGKKDCVPQDVGDCAKKLSGGKLCVPFATHNLTEQFWAEVGDCAGPASNQSIQGLKRSLRKGDDFSRSLREGDSFSQGDKQCLCKKEKCNTNELIKKFPDPGKFTPRPNKGMSSPHQQISSSKLIFVILTTTAINNYFNGKTTS